MSEDIGLIGDYVYEIEKARKITPRQIQFEGRLYLMNDIYEDFTITAPSQAELIKSLFSYVESIIEPQKEGHMKW